MSVASQLNLLVERLGWTLLHSIWQWLAIGLAGWLVLTMLRRQSPQARYLAAVSLMAAGSLGSVATFVLVSPQNSATQPQPGAVATVPATAEIQSLPGESEDLVPKSIISGGDIIESPEATIILTGATETSPFALAPRLASVQHTLAKWLSALVVGWLLGVVLLSTRLGVVWLRLQRLTHKHSTPIVGPLRECADRLCTMFGIPRTVRLLESALVRVPMTVGWLRPIVFLPTSIATGLAPDQLEALLAHELAHLARRDYLVNLVQCVVEILFFYHPIVWWLSRTIRCEREEACDDLAVSILKSRIVYARALTELAARQIASPAVAVAATNGGLVHRIERLLLPDTVSQQNSRSTSAGLACLAFLVTAAIVTVGIPPLATKSQAETQVNSDVSSAGETKADSPATSVPARLNRALLGGSTPSDGKSIAIPSFAGTVVDSSGQLLASGNVFLRISAGATDGSTGDPAFGLQVASTPCSHGQFTFPALTFSTPGIMANSPDRFDVIDGSGKIRYRNLRSLSDAGPAVQTLLNEQKP